MKLSAEKIEVIRAEKQITIQELAARYGASYQRTRAVINSKNVHAITAGRIAKALGVDVTEIIETEK